LALVPGTDVQVHSVDLDNLSVITGNSKFAFRNASGVWQARGLGTNLSDDGTNILAASRSSWLAIYPLLGGGILGETLGLSMADIGTAQALSDAQIYWCAVYLPNAATLTGVKWFQTVNGSYTADQNNVIGLYSYSAGTLTQVATTGNDGNLWQQGIAMGVASKPFTATYAAAAGLYFIAALYNNSAQTTAPTIGRGGNLVNAGVAALDFTNSAKAYGIMNAQTNIPSPTQVMSGITTVLIVNWFGLY
jgi:hypothetical protein